MTLIDPKRIKKFLEKDKVDKTLKDLKERQLSQEKFIKDTQSLLSESIAKITALLTFITTSSTSDETDGKHKLVDEARGLREELKSSLTLIANTKPYNDNNIIGALTEISNILKSQSNNNISKEIQELTKKVNEDREWDFNIVRDSFGKMTQIRAKQSR